MTTDTTATITEQDELTGVVDAYVASWHEADPAKRAELVEKAWAPEARMVDPLLDLKGYEELATLAPLLAEHYPGHQIRRTSAVDAHHGFCRFTWELVGPDGSPAITGIDVCSIADDGRLQGLVAFFDQ
jgi:hypothetical protein